MDIVHVVLEFASAELPFYFTYMAKKTLDSKPKILYINKEKYHFIF